MKNKSKKNIIKWFQKSEIIGFLIVLASMFFHHTAYTWSIGIILSVSIILNIWLYNKNEIIRKSILWAMIQVVQMAICLFLNLYFYELTIYSIVSLVLEFWLFCSTMICYYGIFIKNWKYENLFLVIAIPYGIFMSLSLPIKSVPDEIAHIYTSYHMADHFLQINDTEYNSFFVREQDQIFLTKPVEYGNNVELMNDIYNSAILKMDEFHVEQDLTVCLDGNDIAYVLPAIGIAVGQLLKWNSFWTLYLGRFLNLLQYILLIYISIKIIPGFKFLPAAVALLPISMQQGMSYSYDSLVIGLSVFVICASYGLKRYLMQDKKNVVSFGCIVAIASLILGSLKNHSYIFISIIPLVVLFSDNNKFRRLLCWIIKCISIIVLSFFIYMVLDELFGFKAFFKEPVNHISWQNGAQGYTVQYFLNNPKDLLIVYARTIVVYSQFYIRSSVSDFLGWLNVHTPLVFIPIFISLCFATVREDCIEFVNKVEKKYYILMMLVTIFGIIFALLIAWTPVNTGVALGVQGRYFLPLFVPVFLVFSSEKIRYGKYGKYIPVIYPMTLMAFSVCLITRF